MKNVHYNTPFILKPSYYTFSREEHQMPHQGSYEPVPYHVYHQNHYASPFESRANPQREMGIVIYVLFRLLHSN